MKNVRYMKSLLDSTWWRICGVITDVLLRLNLCMTKVFNHGYDGACLEQNLVFLPECMQLSLQSCVHSTAMAMH